MIRNDQVLNTIYDRERRSINITERKNKSIGQYPDDSKHFLQVIIATVQDKRKGLGLS